MAPWAGQKALIIAENTATILAIELMVSASAAQLFLKDSQPSSVSREIFNEVNTYLKYDTGDRPLDKEIQGLKSLIISGKLTETVESKIELI
jgi:histidine ammonia-lyase